jgi:predicted nucleic acid-binding protein
VSLFIDSNIPMYVAGREHPLREPSLRLLKRVQEGQIEACTNAEVLQEILHRYSALKRLDLAVAVYEDFARLCPNVLPVTVEDTDRAKEILRNTPGISSRDALHAAVMLNHEILDIATFDRGFDAIPGIRRLNLSIA